MEAGFAVAVVDDGGAEDGPGLFVGQRRANAAGMAEQGVARQLAELLAGQRHVAQGAEAGVHAIGALTADDDALDNGLGVVDPRPGLRRQLEQRTMTGYRDHILPTQGCVGDNDFFSLGHLQPHLYNSDIDAALPASSRASPAPTV